jgi:hypothetical protein
VVVTSFTAAGGVGYHMSQTSGTLKALRPDSALTDLHDAPAGVTVHREPGVR